MEVQGRRKRGWLDSVRNDIREISGEEVYNYATCRHKYVVIHRTHIKVGLR